jgi:hypothetical protein
MAQRFANLYHDRFHFREFVNRIDHLAKLAGMDSPRFESAS